jgi:hypothetical protein
MGNPADASGRRSGGPLFEVSSFSPITFLLPHYLFAFSSFSILDRLSRGKKFSGGTTNLGPNKTERKKDVGLNETYLNRHYYPSTPHDLKQTFLEIPPCIDLT